MQDPVYAWLNRPETWMISSFYYYYYFAPSLRAHGTIHSHMYVGCIHIHCESDDSRIYVRTRSLSACRAYTTAAVRLLLRRPTREVAKNNRRWPFRPAEYNIICLLTIQYSYRRVPTWWPTTTSCSSGSPLPKVSMW